MLMKLTKNELVEKINTMALTSQKQLEIFIKVTDDYEMAIKHIDNMEYANANLSEALRLLQTKYDELTKQNSELTKLVQKNVKKKKTTDTK
jgi:predicted nuclease with TOPRIM domain